MNRDAAIPLILRDAEARKGLVLIALDGRCAAGKTTLAREFRRDHGWSVVPMDHFFLRPEQRTQARLDQPGGNVDHERFLAEVLQPLRAGKAAEYRPYNCHSGDFDAPVRVDLAPVVLVEGSYSCHPDLWDCYDLRFFLTVDPEEQRRRLLAREGAEKAQVFARRWIPLEERYFAAFDVAARCDYCLES